MEFHFFYDQIRSLSEEDYEKIGFSGNPAYYGLRCGEVASVYIPREPLESELKVLIDVFDRGDSYKHAFLCSGPGGAGKSHSQDVLKAYCSEKDIPFIELGERDAESIDIMNYMINLAGVGRVVLFCGCQTSFYERLINLEGVFIIGSGHGASHELGANKNKFKIFNLESDYPLSSDDIYSMLKATLQKIALENAVSIPDSFLKDISQMTINPGLALDSLGACMAILAYKSKNGQEPEMSQDDMNYCCDKHFVRWLSGFRP